MNSFTLTIAGVAVSSCCAAQIITSKQNNMFTLEALKAAHAKVKSGAQYPAYVQEINRMGVTRYSTYVTDGNTIYEGENSYSVQTGPKYATLKIADTGNKEKLVKDLVHHQHGGSDYMTFCRQSADNGIEKWVADLQKMTCTYYDKAGNAMLVEEIPGL